MSLEQLLDHVQPEADQKEANAFKPIKPGSYHGVGVDWKPSEYSPTVANLTVQLRWKGPDDNERKRKVWTSVDLSEGEARPRSGKTGEITFACKRWGMLRKAVSFDESDLKSMSNREAMDRWKKQVLSYRISESLSIEDDTAESGRSYANPKTAEERVSFIAQGYTVNNNVVAISKVREE